MALIFLSWAVTMLLYKPEEDEEKAVKKSVTGPAQTNPAAPVQEIIVESVVEPAVIVPEPATAAPEPAVVTPEPAAATPEQKVVAPEPKPEPAAVVPEPPVVTPEPKIVAPEPKPEPAVVVPEPPVVTPEPKVVAPEPKPEPAVVVPEPPVVTPEPKVVTPEAKPEPAVVAPVQPVVQPEAPQAASTAETLPRQAITLPAGATLQNGRYVIESVLGNGGFGVTYLAIQKGLNRKVAIKEFYMKEYCNRDSVSNHVSMGTAGNMDMVAKFKKQFIKEAQTLAEMFNQHIVKVYDIFEDYGTAYYVMEYISGDSLAKKVVGNPADNATALNYMNQICQALADIHKRNILHLDVKPNNLLFRNNGDLVLIDFGISKHYDEADGSQASPTHIGISKGYAPLEQYNKGGITQFTPATDIYSLGATLYTIVTGKIPPEANVIYEDGLDEFPSSVSPAIQNAIIKAMDPRRKQRPQSIDEFARILNS